MSTLTEQIKEQRQMDRKYEKLIETLEHRQQQEFAHYGKSDFFLFMEDVIGETKELKERWDEL